MNNKNIETDDISIEKLLNFKVATIDEGSSTNLINVTLDSNSLVSENTRTKITLHHLDGSIEVGLGRISLYSTAWLENNPDYKNQVQLLWSEGIDAGDEAKRTVIKAVNQINLVYKIDKNGNKIPSENNSPVYLSAVTQGGFFTLTPVLLVNIFDTPKNKTNPLIAEKIIVPSPTDAAP